MTRLANHLVAAFVAIMITATSFAAVTSVPSQPHIAVAATPLLA